MGNYDFDKKIGKLEQEQSKLKLTFEAIKAVVGIASTFTLINIRSFKNDIAGAEGYMMKECWKDVKRLHQKMYQLEVAREANLNLHDGGRAEQYTEAGLWAEAEKALGNLQFERKKKLDSMNTLDSDGYVATLYDMVSGLKEKYTEELAKAEEGSPLKHISEEMVSPDDLEDVKEKVMFWKGKIEQYRDNLEMLSDKELLELEGVSQFLGSLLNTALSYGKPDEFRKSIPNAAFLITRAFFIEREIQRRGLTRENT